jgi:hypothetical protein
MAGACFSRIGLTPRAIPKSLTFSAVARTFRLTRTTLNALK